MNDRQGLPPTSDRSPRRQPLFWFPILLALAMGLLASPAYGSGMALTTPVDIDHGESVTVEYVTITNLGGMSCQFTVSKWLEPPGGGPADLGEMPVQWDISSANCATPQGNLIFHYEEGELGTGVDESRLRAFRYVGAGTWADQCATPCVIPTSNEVSVNGVTLLGDWTIGDLGDGYPPYPAYPGPTAVTIRGPARGAHFDESGLVLGLSVLVGVGLILGWRLRNSAA